MLAKVSRRIYYLLILVVVTLLLGNTALFFLISNIKTSAEIINTSGRIRGNIQRFAKYVIANEKNYALEARIDTLIKKLKEEEENISLIKKEESIANNIDKCWGILKKEAKIYSPERKDMVMKLSERCWVIADDMTARFEEIAEQTANLYLGVFIVNIALSFFALVALIIISRKDVQNKLEIRANYDNLTKLLNRYSFIEIYNTLSQNPENYPMSIMILDVDNFKKVNDTYGHNIGDVVLKTLAQIIRNSVRKDDIVARWGGEEFTILSPKTDIKGASVLAEKVRKAVESYRFPEVGRITVSIGVAEVLPYEDLVSVIKKADKALYEAKKKGKNRVDIYREDE